MLHDPVELVRGLRSGVIDADWIRLAATLAAVAAGVAVLGLPRAQPVDGRRVHASLLPFERVPVGEQRLDPAHGRSALIYVLPSCHHCDSAMGVFAGALQRPGFRGLVVACSGRADAGAYQRRFGLTEIGIVSSRELARGAGVSLVPTLISFADSTAVITPVPSPQWLRRELVTR